MELFEYLKEIRCPIVECGSSPNQYSSKPLCLKPTPESAIVFNKVYSLCKGSEMSLMERTKSGAIAKNYKNMYCWDVRHNNSGGVITIYAYGCLYVVKLGNAEMNKSEIKTYEAFNTFYDKCLEYGINLEDYAINNGAAVKETIERPYIYIFPEYIGKTPITKVNHLDFHSSYPAGLVNTHNEFRDVVEFFYNGRKENPLYKNVLNMSIGMMQSINVKTINGKWAHLSKDAIEDNNKRIKALASRLVAVGRELVGFNTDGIFYRGEVYHDENEGDKLGQWSNDHINCIFRAKSSGAYEFIENGQYYPVVRGNTGMDKIKPRSQWQWGDIFKSSVIYLSWNDDIGFEIHNEDE